MPITLVHGPHLRATAATRRALAQAPRADGPVLSYLLGAAHSGQAVTVTITGDTRAPTVRVILGQLPGRFLEPSRPLNGDGAYI